MATVGKFDGQHPSLAYATTGGKVCIHSPHASEDLPTLQYLNINKEITSLAAGQLDPSLPRDVLLVGTSNSIQAYDVFANKDLFFKEIQDGAKVLAVGQLGTGKPSVLVGGTGCALAVDAQGNEQYWTVAGGTVSALTLSSVGGKGRQELLLGSDDFSIRALHGESVVLNLTEADQVVGLATLEGSQFGYALANGTVGVYDKSNRVWRVKSKHTLTALCSHDIDGDNELELISGWSNGRVCPMPV